MTIRFSGVVDTEMQNELSKYYEDIISKVNNSKLSDVHKQNVSNLNIEIEFNNRMISKGGDANYKLSRVRLNYRAHKLNPHQTAQTFYHEMAHLIARCVCGDFISPHGQAWQDTMHMLGKKPDRCHSMDVSALRKKPDQAIIYKCSCSSYNFTSKRHLNAMTGRAVYSCKKCKCKLNFSEIIGNLIG